MAVAGHHTFEGQQLPSRGLALFLAGIFLFGVSWLLAGESDRQSLRDSPGDDESVSPPAGEGPFVGRTALAVGGLALVFGVMAFLLNGNNLFTPWGSFFWISGSALFVAAFWELPGWLSLRSLRSWLRARQWPRINVVRLWPLVVLLAIVAIAAFFRLYRLEDVPREMISDHAEKALDIQSVLDGQYHVYFPRNTGREPFQMYVAAALVKVAELNFDFYVIKLATALPSILVVPATYFLARELFDNRKIAILAAAFTAVAFWPVATGRVGLRFAYGSLFVALTLAFLLRALKYQRRNDFLLCGLLLGLGMYGYMAFRAMPVVVGACLALKFGADFVAERRRPNLSFLSNSSLLVLTFLLVFAPLGRYAVEFPHEFWYRILTRGGSSEVPVHHPVTTFFSNLRNAFLMFDWRGDIVWVLNIPFRPALDFVMGALFVLGVLILLLRWLRFPELRSVYLLIAFLALMMPTVMSIAFPVENPAFGRSAGLIPLGFVLVALPVYYGGCAIRRLIPQTWGAVPVMGLAVALVAWVSLINYHDYFNEYDEIYLQNANNVTEVAAAMREFADSGPGIENTYIKIWPYWLDTRSLALTLGDFHWNNVLDDIRQASSQIDTPGPKLYVLHPEDIDSLNWLRNAYPAGRAEEYQSKVGKDFILFVTTPGAPLPAPSQQ